MASPKPNNYQAKVKRHPTTPGVRAGIELMGHLGGIQVLGNKQHPYYYFPPIKRQLACIDLCTRCMLECGPHAACHVQPFTRVAPNLYRSRKCHYCVVYPEDERCSFDGALFCLDDSGGRLVRCDADDKVPPTSITTTKPTLITAMPYHAFVLDGNATTPADDLWGENTQCDLITPITPVTPALSSPASASTPGTPHTPRTPGTPTEVDPLLATDMVIDANVKARVNLRNTLSLNLDFDATQTLKPALIPLTMSETICPVSPVTPISGPAPPAWEAADVALGDSYKAAAREQHANGHSHPTPTPLRDHPLAHHYNHHSPLPLHPPHPSFAHHRATHSRTSSLSSNTTSPAYHPFRPASPSPLVIAACRPALLASALPDERRAQDEIEVAVTELRRMLSLMVQRRENKSKGTGSTAMAVGSDSSEEDKVDGYKKAIDDAIRALEHAQEALHALRVSLGFEETPLDQWA